MATFSWILQWATFCCSDLLCVFVLHKDSLSANDNHLDYILVNWHRQSSVTKILSSLRVAWYLTDFFAQNVSDKVLDWEVCCHSSIQVRWCRYVENLISPLVDCRLLLEVYFVLLLLMLIYEKLVLSWPIFINGW